MASEQVGDNMKAVLQEALKEVKKIESMWDEYEKTKDKNIPAEVTRKMKLLTTQLRDLSTNPKCKTKENAPLLQQLSLQMKELVKRTKELVTPRDPSSNTPNSSASSSSSANPVPPTQLKGWLKKQGEDMFKAWKKRYFVLNGSRLYYYYSQQDAESSASPLGYIDLQTVTQIQTHPMVKNQFHLVTPSRTYNLQTLLSPPEEYSLASTWIAAISQHLKVSDKDTTNKASTASESTAITPSNKDGTPKDNKERIDGQEQERRDREDRERLDREEKERREREDRERREREEKERRDREEKERRDREEKERKDREEQERRNREERERRDREEQERRDREEKERRDKAQRESEEREKLERETAAQRQRENEEREKRLREEQAQREREEHNRRQKELEQEQKIREDKEKREKELQRDKESKAREVNLKKDSDVSNKQAVYDSPTQEKIKDITVTSPRANFTLPDNFEQQSKDEQISILKMKLNEAMNELRVQSINKELFLKLQSELKQKEKQYEFLRGRQKLDQEGKKLAEERVDALRLELKKKDEELQAKDKHIRQLSKKLKQARKDWLMDQQATASSGTTTNTDTPPMLRPSTSLPTSHHSWELNPEIDIKNREIKQLQEAIWAHQNQNANLNADMNRLLAENKANLKVKDEVIHRLEKELAFIKETYQSIREKYLQQQVGLLDPQDKSLLSELQKVKKELFFSLALGCKLTARNDCNVNIHSLYERAIAEDVAWSDWSEWIATEINKPS